MRQRMCFSLYQTADKESLYQTADAGNTLSDSRCRCLSIRRRMQEKLFQTAYAEVSLSNSGCRRHSIRQLMQDDTLSAS